MVTRTRVTVNVAAIQSLFQPGGDAMAFARKVGREIESVAVATAPTGTTGRLKRNHRVYATPRNLYGCYSTVTNDTPYASWVHGGTANNGASFIRPKRAKRLGPFPGLGGVLIAPSKVRGQRANPWLNRAGATVMLRYGVVVPPADR